MDDERPEVGAEPDQHDDESSREPDQPDPLHEDATDADEAEAADDEGGPWGVPDEEPGWMARPRPRLLRPWEALERLDAQWEDRRPLPLQTRLQTLQLTDREDPRAFDYVGAMTGASDAEIADVYTDWLRAQLAADAVSIGRSSRPSVALVPANRLWWVVRSVFGIVILIDGPGFLTPGAAVRAALRRYRAELQGELARGAERPKPEASATADVSPAEKAEADEGSVTGSEGQA